MPLPDVWGELPGISLPRTRVNKGKKEGRVVRCPGLLPHLALEPRLSPTSPCMPQPHQPSLGVG